MRLVERRRRIEQVLRVATRVEERRRRIVVKRRRQVVVKLSKWPTGRKKKKTKRPINDQRHLVTAAATTATILPEMATKARTFAEINMFLVWIQVQINK